MRVSSKSKSEVTGSGSFERPELPLADLSFIFLQVFGALNEDYKIEVVETPSRG